MILKSIEDHQAMLDNIIAKLIPDIEQCAQAMIDCIHTGGTIFWCGNGGSASDAEHLCAELVGRFNRERRSMSSISLTANTSTITSIGNDYGYDFVFSRQVEGLVRKGDVLIGISTSGNSVNVEHAINKAHEQGCKTIGFLGREGGSLAKVCDIVLNVEGKDTARIQEMHILIGHILCDRIELFVLNSVSQGLSG